MLARFDEVEGGHLGLAKNRKGPFFLFSGSSQLQPKAIIKRFHWGALMRSSRSTGIKARTAYSRPVSGDMPLTRARAEQLELIAIDDLRAWERNARTHSRKQFRQVARSIEKFGFTNPVLIDEDNRILAGHGRVEAAKLLNIRHVPCRRLANMNAAEKRACVIADNQLALKSR
jgi:hypothetical protein